MTWERRFVELAHYLAKQWSKDPSTKVGCVLVDPENQAVITTGVNGFPRGIEEHVSSGRWARPTKYDYCEHAERNAIYNAARLGHRTEGSVAYMNWNPGQSICPPCARALIQSGITAVYGVVRSPQDRHDVDDDGGWRASCDLGAAMLEEAGVKLMLVPHTEVDNERA